MQIKSYDFLSKIKHKIRRKTELKILTKNDCESNCMDKNEVCGRIRIINILMLVSSCSLSLHSMPLHHSPVTPVAATCTELTPLVTVRVGATYQYCMLSNSQMPQHYSIVQTQLLWKHLNSITGWTVNKKYSRRQEEGWL
jgi:hypothetical protein